MRTPLTAGTAALLALAVAAPAPAYAAPGPSPAPRNTREVAKAPILDISGRILDITDRTSNLDGSLTDVDGKDRRTIIVAADVVFAFDKATLNGKAKSRLAEVATRLRSAARGKTVSVDGYTDAKGSAGYNQKLSERRAQAVRKALEARLSGAGITFTAKGHGSANPIAPNTKTDGQDNPEGRAKNRRVEIGFPR